MTVFVAPCGVSIFDGIRCDRLCTPDAFPDGLVADTRSWAERVKDGMHDEQALLAWQQIYRRHAADAALDRWSSLACAETSTLAARTDNLNRLLDSGHAVLLLASDTAEGLAAAILVAGRISRGHLDRLRYASTPTSQQTGLWQHRFPAGTATIVRILGLDPRVRGGFHTATAGIGRALRAAIDSAGDQQVEVHLTAGFKATLLHTLAMTEVALGLPPGRVSAWYLYDDSTGSAGPAVQIGLRRFAREQIDDMRAELVEVRDTKRMSRSVFRGVAWEERADGAHLNDFGTGYLAVLGEPLRAPGDRAGVVS